MDTFCKIHVDFGITYSHAQVTKNGRGIAELVKNSKGIDTFRKTGWAFFVK